MNESSSLTSRKMAPIKITIIEGDSSDLLPVVVLLAKGGRTPASPFSEGFRVGTLEDLFNDLRQTLAREEPDGEGEGEGGEAPY
jgi:hypothetical protein